MEAETEAAIQLKSWRAEEVASRVGSERSAKEREAARRALLDSLSRGGLLRSSGSILVNLDNCDEIRATLDIERLIGISRPEEKEWFLAMEKHIWDAAMDFWKSKDISCEYDLISDTMTMYPMLEGHCCYHCSLMGQKRDIARPSSVFIFIEVKCKSEPTKERSYSVMSCVMLDEKSRYDCKMCPTFMHFRHPPRE